jgi:hypothetical protein
VEMEKARRKKIPSSSGLFKPSEKLRFLGTPRLLLIFVSRIFFREKHNPPGNTFLSDHLVNNSGGFLRAYPFSAYLFGFAGNLPNFIKQKSVCRPDLAEVVIFNPETVFLGIY